MIKVSILNKQNEIGWFAQFNTQQEADAWINQEVSNNSWGKPDRWVRENQEDVSQALETREVQNIEGSYLEYKLAAEYEITQEDLTSQILTENRFNKLNNLRILRDNKLKRVDLLINIAVLNSWTSAEKLELKNFRQALLDITDPYKNDMSLCDVLDLDNFIWPNEPSIS